MEELFVMTHFVEPVLLGILKALTELFPLSYPAHRLFLEKVFHYPAPAIPLEISVEIGILAALLVFYIKDLYFMILEIPALFRFPFSQNKSSYFGNYPHALMLSLLLVASLATLAVHVCFFDAGQTFARWPGGMGIPWLNMGVLLLFSKALLGGNRTSFEMNHQDAFLIGLVQGLAVFPGVSRSGIAILMGLALGLERKDAARFGFLLGIPFLLASLFFRPLQELEFYFQDSLLLAVSFLAAFLMGIFSLSIVVRIIEKGAYYLFGFYVSMMGILTLAHTLILKAL